MKLLALGSLMLIILALPLSARAATHAVTGGTNGSTCSSGGYFTPSQITIASGDTITFSVPANDPYSGGLQIHGFPEGNFTILPGGSHVTTALTTNVSYYGTWPSSGCMKGSGSVTVTAPTTPPPATPAPGGSTTTRTTTAKTSTTATPKPTPSASTTPTPTPSPSLSAGPSASPSPTQSPTLTANHKSGPSLFLAASTGILGIAVIAALVALGLLLKRRFITPPEAPAVTPPAPPSVIPPTPVQSVTSSNDINKPLT